MGFELTSRAELYYTLDSGKPVTASPFLCNLGVSTRVPTVDEAPGPHHYWVVAHEQLENKGYKPLPQLKKKKAVFIM